MSTPVDAGRDGRLSANETYVEAQRFYARHMLLLDSGDAQGWAATFTEDGSFRPPAVAEPVRGRAALAAAARQSAAELAAAGESRRHWLGMVSVSPQDDGSLRARSYAQVFVIASGGEPRLWLTAVCDDVLVRENGELKVRERVVTRDGG